MNQATIRDYDVPHVACNGDGCSECNNGTLPDLRTVRPGPKRKHGPNITVSTKRFNKPRTYVHARIAVEQLKSDIAALHRLQGTVYSPGRSASLILASVSLQVNEIRRYLDGE